MKLICKYKMGKMEEYFCALTKDMDKLARIKEDSHFKHYLLIEKTDMKSGTERVLPMRIPGGTVGAVYIDKDNIITKIIVDTNYVVKSYPKDVEKTISAQYIGTEVEFD